MDADNHLARIAGAISEPARARMLCCLLDGHARTSTELSVVGQISASTASAHLTRLSADGLVCLSAQGKHRYYSLASAEVAAALEALLVVAGVPRSPFKSTAPTRLQAARTCYDHMAGQFAVALHDRLIEAGWMTTQANGEYGLSPAGESGFTQAGFDVAALRRQRRRFACPCLDWSERRPHLGGALGAELLRVALATGWVEQNLDSRALSVAPHAWRSLMSQLRLKAAA